MSEIQHFVGASHGDIDAVRAGLEVDPTLANCAWDWAAMLPLYREEPIGPHGIPLRAHAEAGKATRVLELLAAG